MTITTHGSLRATLLATCALGFFAGTAHAADAAGAASAETQGASSAAASSVEEIVVTATNTTRSAVTLGAVEMQKILPGVNPLKAIQTLPGVVFETADPWGNNEQNETLYRPRLQSCSSSASPSTACRWATSNTATTTASRRRAR